MNRIHDVHKVRSSNTLYNGIQKIAEQEATSNNLASRPQTKNMSNCHHFWRSFDREPNINVEIVYICKAFRKIRDNSNLILDLSL